MDLSVQVHPDDAYAMVNEKGDLGKTECWYIIDCKEDADMIFGHNAQSREELVGMIYCEESKSSLVTFSMCQAGRFKHYVKVRLFWKHNKALIQRTGYMIMTAGIHTAGNLRNLHLDKAIEVTTVPHQNAVTTPKVEERRSAKITSFVESEFFSVYKWEIIGQTIFSFTDKYLLLSVIKGDGTLIHNGEQYPLKKGTHFIVPVGFGEFELEGQCELIVSHT